MVLYQFRNFVEIRFDIVHVLNFTHRIMNQFSMQKSSLLNDYMIKIILALPGIYMVSTHSTLAQNYPPSPVIEDIIIEDKCEISFGDGDNFPVTWADDGKLYTLYCDGVGFDDIPLDQNISNGFAELICTPFTIGGKNIPSPDIEFDGSGRSGRKASGLVCIKGVLYSLVRNLNTDGTGMSLFWSADKGVTWIEAEWS
jgi:hypothetical protein